MKKNVIIRAILAAIFCLIISGLTACQPPVNYDEAAIRAYADPATEITLQGLSEGNLEKYTQYGNAEFKAAVTQKILDTLKPNMDEQLGTYVSREFLRIDGQGEYIFVHYNVKYSKSEVGVRMVFDKDHLVAGQWFE
jgi:hypothetical protein